MRTIRRSLGCSESRSANTKAVVVYRGENFKIQFSAKSPVVGRGCSANLLVLAAATATAAAAVLKGMSFLLNSSWTSREFNILNSLQYRHLNSSCFSAEMWLLPADFYALLKFVRNSSPPSPLARLISRFNLALTCARIVYCVVLCCSVLCCVLLRFVLSRLLCRRVATAAKSSVNVLRTQLERRFPLPLDSYLCLEAALSRLVAILPPLSSLSSLSNLHHTRCLHPTQHARLPRIITSFRIADSVDNNIHRPQCSCTHASFSHIPILSVVAVAISASSYLFSLASSSSSPSLRF